MRKRISILGSTGSVGTQTLEVIRQFPEEFEVVGLSAGDNLDLLIKQIQEFKPKIVSIKSYEKLKEIKHIITHRGTELTLGLEGLNQVATAPGVDIVVNALSGCLGLIPTLAAIRKGKNIALANKETLVVGGNIIMEEANKANIKLLPVDSEHSAIFQCLQGENKKDINKIILTASGGPFRGFKRKDLINVTPEEALKHPNWSMGSKITIDSATLMNKGLEVIEAHWLFDLDYSQIKVVIHPQSIIHSMVEFSDGSIIAQMGPPDMRIPIQYALFYPERKKNNFPKMNFIEYNQLTFDEPDTQTFPSLALAYEAGKIGGSMPVVLNAANEVAVNLFLTQHIGFLDIPRLVEKIMNKHKVVKEPSLEDIKEIDEWAREEALRTKL